MKKILILYATYGSGHKAVANYIEKYFKIRNPRLEILNINILDYSNKKVGKFSEKISDFFLLKFPLGWDFIYNITNNKLGSFISSKAQLSLFKKKELIDLIKDFNPDVTICTHFSGSDVVKYCNKKGYTNSKIVTIVTDYKTHLVWTKETKKQDAIIISNIDEIDKLSKKGIYNKILMPIGIPIYPVLSKYFNKKALIKEFGFDNKNKICLFFGGGGNGGVHSLPYIKKIIKSNININFIYIAGRNLKSKAKVDKWIDKYGACNVKTLGYVNNVPELINISDFIVTKPGGIQLTECLHYKKPVIMFNSSGGQEEGNSKFIEKNNLGKMFRRVRPFIKYIKEIEVNDDILKEYNKSHRKYKNDTSMEKFYDMIKEMIK